MPYIPKERVAEIRKEVRRTFPEYKISVRMDGSSSINVVVQSGPIQLEGKSYQTINHYYYESHYSDQPEVLAFLRKLIPIVRSDVGVESYDGDYGTIPTYYTHFSFGNWDRPYEVT